MAKRIARKRRSSQGHFSQFIREIVDSPEVKFVAEGVAAAVLARLATNMSGKYPELSKFLKKNIETLEERLEREAQL